MERWGRFIYPPAAASCSKGRVGRLRWRFVSALSAAQMSFCSSVVSLLFPNSDVQILNRLTPESRASRL